MEEHPEVSTLNKLNSLRIFIKNLNLNESTESAIMNKLAFEIEYAERCAFLTLGKCLYEKEKQ